MTHKKEIKYWAEHPDGTKVWARTQSEDWVILGIPSWAPDVIYIVDDEWVELRKAQVDGATIQRLLPGKRWHNVDNDWWKTSFYEIYRYAPTNLFRIKPKEWYEDIPKEGVICWVWDEDENKKRLRLITDFYQNAEYQFKETNKGFYDGDAVGWKHAEPVKPEECWKGEKDEPQ